MKKYSWSIDKENYSGIFDSINDILNQVKHSGYSGIFYICECEFPDIGYYYNGSLFNAFENIAYNVDADFSEYCKDWCDNLLDDDPIIREEYRELDDKIRKLIVDYINIHHEIKFFKAKNVKQYKINESDIMEIK